MQKAQSGTSAAVLVAIISAIIILYIIFLPNEDRLPLIGENKTSSGETSEEDTLLLEEQIKMYFIDNEEIEHNIPSINLYASTDANVIREENSIYVKNGVFDKQDKEIQFNLENKENTKNILISFDAKKYKGRLTIKLNDHEIFNGEITKVNVEPIKVPEDYIASSNTLKMEVSGVGIAFWSTNEYLLENLKITADITDTSTRESESTFIVPKSEADNVDKMLLKFVPECRIDSVGVLKVNLNGKEIYSGIPDCGIPIPIEFSTINILRGENKISFSTGKGRYLIDQIKITSEMKDSPTYTFSFNLDSDQYKDVKANNKIVNLTFYFVDDEEDKEAELIINGNNRIDMTRHHKVTWSANLNSFMERGSNTVKVVPSLKLDVRKLIIKLDDRN